MAGTLEAAALDAVLAGLLRSGPLHCVPAGAPTAVRFGDARTVLVRVAKTCTAYEVVGLRCVHRHVIGPGVNEVQVGAPS